MRWYWVVCCDNTVTTPFVGDEGDLGGHEDDLNVCRRIEVWPGTAWVRASRADRDGDPDDALQTCFPTPIYSARLRDALEEANVAGIQYLPIRVFRTGRSEIPGFSVANILNCVEGLDVRRSEIERFPDDYFLPARRGQIRSINSAVLMGAAVDRYDVLRLSGYPSHLYASERFVELFEAKGFTGYSFREVPSSGTAT
jgi:hypothetical protein